MVFYFTVDMVEKVRRRRKYLNWWLLGWISWNRDRKDRSDLRKIVVNY
jgi:hypothetical protein